MVRPEEWPAASLPAPVRERLRAIAGRRVSREGVLIITAHRFRSQEQNRNDAIERLVALIREAEQRNAARTLGVARVEFLGYPDCEVEDTRELRRDVTRQIRRWRPDLVIAMNPHRSYNLGGSHRDHRITAGVALDCVYPLARDHLAFPELMPDYEPHKVLEIHLMQWENPHLVVDISDVMDLKLKALACHASQFADFPAVEKRVRERSAELGKPKGYAYAETFDRVVLAR